MTTSKLPIKLENDVQQKIADFVGDKNLEVENAKIADEDSLIFWVADYFHKIVKGAKEKTKKAKQNDLQRFLSFFENATGSYHLDFWTVSVSKEFQKFLLNHQSAKTKDGYKATTINRIFATLKHLARYIEDRRGFKGGYPFKDFKDLMQDEPDWNGLTDRQLMLLRSACDQRLKICARKNQNPLLEAAVFYSLLHTGMREFELCSLKLSQYYNKGFHDVKRKGRMVTKRIFLADDARSRVDVYLEDRFKNQIEGQDKNQHLFLNRYNNPLTEKDVFRICERISNQACAYLKDEDKFKLRPHQLRHSFLKRAADKYGLSYAKKVSGNIGDRELYRYTAPSQAEVEEKMMGVFG